MARKSYPPPPLQRAVLSSVQIKVAIPKLERRLGELQQVQIEHWDDDVQNALDSLQAKVDHTLIDVFGSGTLDYERFNVPPFWTSVAMSVMETPQIEWMTGYREAIASAIAKLKTAIEVLKEQLLDMGESPEGQALQAYQGLDLHPEIDRAAGQLYRNSHYSNAIEDSVKALNTLVRLRSGIDDLDGTKLMERVFNPTNPVLRFNQLADESDRNEQRGFMMLFSGAVAGLRNPRAHKLIQDDPERAIEFIAFVSLLAKLLDGAEKVIAH